MNSSLVRLFASISLILVTSFSLNAQERPNIVILLADDLGWGDLSCYGSPENETPHLDALADEGAKFTNFYAACAVCSPSRAATLTGRYPVRVGVYSWISSSHNMHLRVEETTIAELLKEANYQTAHVGKWHLGYDLEDGSGDGPDPGDHGFDHWMATGNNASPSHRNPRNFVKNGEALGELEGYSCDLVVNEGIDWLKTTKDSHPFFLNLWFHEPHRRVAAPPELAARHADTKEPEYYGCIENMDQAVGRLLKHLEETGKRENTLIIFTSDNGSYMPGSNGHLKGRKTTLWEGGIREPAMFVWPGQIPAKTVCETPAGIVDILPTVCEAVGIEAPQDRTLDGMSLFPVFENPEMKRPQPLYWFYNPSRPVCVIRDNQWCLIADPTLDLSRSNMFQESFIGPIKETGLTNFRLYNLEDDPSQENDLAAAHPDVTETMKSKMRTIHNDVVDEAYDWRSK